MLPKVLDHCCRTDLRIAAHASSRTDEDEEGPAESVAHTLG